MRKIDTLVLTAILFLSTSGYAYGEFVAERGSFSRGYPGARAAGMGGAFVGLADDSLAPLWNPAGLVDMGENEISFTQSDLGNLGLIKKSLLSMTTNYPKQGGAGLVWFQHSFDLKSWKESEYIVSYARMISYSLSLGGNLKWHKVDSDFEDGKAKGWAADIGLMMRWSDKLKLGVMAWDIHSKEKWETGLNQHLPWEAAVGVSLKPLHQLRVNGDIYGSKEELLKGIRLGGEYWFSLPNQWRLALRGGLSKSFIGKKRNTICFGGGVRVEKWELDYAYLLDQDGLPDTHRFSISARY